ncbi:MAG: hypothetical protein ACRDHJ_01855 [Actinomycetota bacterium]
MINEEMAEWPAAATRAADKRAGAWHDFFQAEREERAEWLGDVSETAQVVEIQEKYEGELLAHENVIGVAAGIQMTKGKPTGKRSLTVFVETKKPKAQLSKEDVVPGELDGIPTDVVETGPIRPLLFTARVRPALPGFSIGHHDITAGTFGCVVRDIRRCCCGLEKSECGCSPTHEECRGDYLVLSNNHVLAASNLGTPGDLIVQPGPFDGGVYPSDGIATLDRFEPLIFGRNGYNLVDAAVARPTFDRNLTPPIIGLVIPSGVAQAFVGQRVVKAGRTTQVRTGRVLAINATIIVGPYPGGLAQFRQQIVTTSIGAPGDSGSLLMDSSLNAVGLLFAGSPEITIHNHIANVETALGVRPLTAPRFG